MKRAFAFIIAFFLSMSTFIPLCFADYSSQPRGFWDVALYKLCQFPDAVSVDIGGLSLNLGPFSRNSQLNSHLSENICADSSDHLHHADSLNEWQGNNINSEHGSYAYATCKFCGKTFKYYSDDLQQDYQDYLHDNNLDSGVSVSPSGSIVWRPTISDVNSYQTVTLLYKKTTEASGTATGFSPLLSFSTSSTNSIIKNGSAIDNYSFRASITQRCSGCTFEIYGGYFYNYLYTPFPGTYTSRETIYISGSGVSEYYPSVQFSIQTEKVPIPRDSSFPFNRIFSNPLTLGEGVTGSLVFTLPVYDVIPSTSFSPPPVPSNITINNNTYHVTDLDFNSRTFFVDNNKTIIYDDDKIIIKQGDTVIEEHNYYIENPDPGEDPADSSGSGSGSAAGGSGCCEQCALLLRQANQYLLQIQTLVDQINDKLGSDSDNYMEGIYNLLIEINNALDNLSTDPHSDYEDMLTSILNQLVNIRSDLTDIKSSLSAIQTNTATTNQKLDTVHTDLQAVLAELKEQKGVLRQILDEVRKILSHVTSIDENGDFSTEEKKQTFIGNFIGKFGFINDVYRITAQMMRDVTNDAVSAQAVSDGIIPSDVLTAGHASDSEEPSGDESTSNRLVLAGPSRSGGTAPEILTRFPDVTVLGFNLSEYSAIDFSWYAPYKSEVDIILSGFMYLSYIWVLFKRLPSIIRGGAMVSSDYMTIESEYMGDFTKKGE